ncbi:MAG: protein kinase [Planctomycetaceae bacterium]|nr:protein kinase [Planctomycetaceae bacterium]
MSANRPSEPRFDPRQPIPGYVTRELIGRGGFGEVWKADAPGGLTKAIKIVHAGVDSSRAERELRALQRIRDVRHPLILSIERIEIIGGTLVIVTELADGSLRDVFHKYRTQGKTGIPRDRLLALMRDAADALDYIYEEHSLQHLDIKPENLLVVGNRLKIGDFGLIKNIYERGASLVNGLTPTYAPPELFEGKPTRQSDQYSLAIVYQHMLTGELPFDGATPAQLAREHLAGVPRLSLLSRAERPIIARSLAKSPADRFESCKSLIDRLAAANIDPLDTQEPVEDRQSETARTNTVPLNGVLAPAGAAPGSEPPPSPALDPLLSAIEVSLHTKGNNGDTTSRRSDAILGAGFVPTVFVGVGGAGGTVLQQLQVRMEDALGTLGEIPSIQMVLVDTDGRALNVLMREHNVARAMDVAALPLRRPEDYKFRDSKLNKWLHRRWIYNMPRSLATEGYRPLGRLAMVDHGPRVITSIKTAIAKAASAENATKSAEATGIPFRHGHVRIVFVSSISGATGSGMLLDLAYAARQELKKRSLSDEDVVACLLHATPGNPAERDKAVANAYALLSELGHYSSPGHFYPGEPAIETSQFHGDNRTFGTTYLINLGNDVDGQRWQAAAAEVAEYLYLTTATAAKMVVDAARHTDEAQSSRSRTTVLVRSLNVHRLDRAYRHDVAACIAQSCRDVLTLWESGNCPVQPAAAKTVDRAAVVDLGTTPAKVASVRAAARAAEWIEGCHLHADSLQQMSRRLHEKIWNAEEHDYLQQFFQQFCSEAGERGLLRQQVVDSAVRSVDRLLGEDPDIEADQTATLQVELRNRLAECAGTMASWLSARVRELVDQSDAGIAAARSATSALASQIAELRSELERRRKSSAETAAQVLQTLLQGPPAQAPTGFALFKRRQVAPPAIPQSDELAVYAARRLDDARLKALQSFLDTITSQVGGLTDQLNQLSRELSALSTEFPDPEPVTETARFAGPETQSFVERIRHALVQRREAIALAVHEEIGRSVLTGDQKLQRYVGVRSELHGVLKAPMAVAARRVVNDFIRQTTLEWIAESARESEAGNQAACGRLVQEFLTERKSRTNAVLDPVLVLAPDSVEPRVLSSAFASCKGARLVPARTNGITVFAEIAPRPLEDVADSLIQGQELYRQLAQKLHTREDVDWSPLPPPRAARRSDSGKAPSVQVHNHATPPK